MSKMVKARGLSCPQPVMMALRAIAENNKAVVVGLDHETAAQNVARACRENGRSCLINKTADGYPVEVSSK